jgi:hypothetical protein
MKIGADGAGRGPVNGRFGLRPGPLGIGRRALGACGTPWVGLAGAHEGQSAVAVELEEVVDGALEAPLGARGGLAA